ncbi:hypothetical protein [Actinocrispum sp. NPDC049592]|uniref:hypothetical protein n=1 Tax=Actinocrispum sp. NPDC049592 TaxID=3154835 RepID=UPI00342C8960
MPAFLRQLPLRLTAGAYILNSGLSKRQADELSAKHLQQMASTAYPAMARMEPARFAALLSTAEVVLGSALLVPFVPGRVAGAGLTAFAAGLLGLYLRIPGLREKGGLRPTEQGMALAKDVWLLGMGLSLTFGE